MTRSIVPKHGQDPTGRAGFGDPGPFGTEGSPTGEKTTGVLNAVSGTGLGFVMVNMVNGDAEPVSNVQMDASVFVTLIGAISPDASGNNATALFYPALNASIIFQPSGQLDPQHPATVQIQVGNGPVNSGVVQGSKGVEIDVSHGGGISSRSLPTNQ